PHPAPPAPHLRRRTTPCAGHATPASPTPLHRAPTGGREGRLAARHGPHDQVGLRAGRDRGRERCIGRLVRQVLFAREEPDARPALPTVVPADRAAQHRVPGLQRIQDSPLGDLALDLQLHLAVHPGERAQVRGEHYPDHDSVWTSTESTAGRSRTIGAQLSPASADAYTWPPVVPKYTPQSSSEATAIPSRSTLP